MAWTEERIERLKVFWAKGLSCSRCAAELGGDITRNAVIGKVSRLGLPGRATIRNHRTAAEYRKANKLKRRSEATERPTCLGPRVTGDLNSLRKALETMDAEPDDIGVGRLVINHEDPSRELKSTSCRWPIGDPGDAEFHFCGRDKIDGLPYCTHHARIAFVPQVRKTNAEFVDLQRKQRERKLA